MNCAISPSVWMIKQSPCHQTQNGDNNMVKRCLAQSQEPFPVKIRRRNRMAWLWGKKPPNPLFDINQAGYKQPSRGSWRFLWVT
jgi:hypothetical protein